MMKNEWTVAQLLTYLKKKLDTDSLLQSIWVVGEISNFTAHSSGHFYFTLKDEFARISCVMFAGYAARIVFTPHDGQKVLVRANTSLYEKSGQLQLYITQMTDYGMGLLYERYEQLKKQLGEEGLFAEERKKPLPRFPFRIAVVTGQGTAARQDVLTTLKRRWPIARIDEFNCLVQGEGAYLTIIEALAKADADQADVIILARGGGSIEDLWSFNEEKLIRFIAMLKTPLITGVGHETDITLVDLISDHRANTPTGAAELATPRLDEVLLTINQNQTRIASAMDKILDTQKTRLVELRHRRIFTEPSALWQTRSLNLMMNIKALNTFAQRMHSQRVVLEHIRVMLQQRRIYLTDRPTQTLIDRKRLLAVYMSSHLQSERHNFAHRIELLNAYSPLNIIRKGYAVVTADQTVIRSVKQITLGDNLDIKISDGTLRAVVIAKEYNDERNEF